MADEPKTAGGETQQAAQPAQPQAPQFTVDATALLSTYTNWYRVTGTPEELVIDFGLNPQMGQLPTAPIKVTDRLVMNFFTAKRLLGALMNVINQYENTYGALELDFQRRMRPQVRPGTTPPGGNR